MSNFVHLHVHTEYSLLDGLTKIKQLVNTVKEMGMTSIAITDHGVMYGAIEFYKACLKENIKPIIGCEVYVSPKNRLIKTPSNKKNYHLTLLAKNKQGYKNLMKLVSLSFLEGFYYKPRVDDEILKKYRQGLICLSGCLQGEIDQKIIDKKVESAKKTALKYQKIFKDDFYLEIQPHPDIPDQIKANHEIVKISRELGIPLVATNDVHYLNKDDAFAQDVLVMINTQTTVNDKNRLSMANTPDFYLKSPKTMADQLKEYPDAIQNTVKIADKCNLNIEIGKWYFPKFKLPEGEDAKSWLIKKTYIKAELIYGKPLPKDIKDRLDYELNIICSKGYSAYFLIMEDFIRWTEKNDTITNTRGSAAGSLVSFCLGITSVDPLIYQLPFERFLNAQRPSPPDIDLDVSDDKRQKMLYHIIDQYGQDSVAQVCTFGRMLARGAVRDTARVLGYEYAVGDRISKLIPIGSQGFPMTINKALDTTSDLKNLYNTDIDAKKIIDIAKQIEGCARHISVHACALVISPTTLNDFCPIQTETGGDKTITQYEMHAIEDVGLIKFDILGIRNLSILSNSIVNVRKTQKIKIDMRSIPLDDKKTFEMLTQGHTMGVFQLSGSGMTKWLKQLKPERVEDLMAMVALYRPGPMAIIPEYIKRKEDPSTITYADPRMAEYLQQSYGLIVYQDDCLYTAIKLAGYDWVEADKFRKAIGKKIPEEMKEQKDKFIKGCVNNGLTKKKAEEIFDLIEPFVGYGFNKAHACSYGMLAYRTAYMKANYPVEYMCALLSAESEDIEKIAAGVEECRNLGIIINPPDVNLSAKGFKIEKNPNSLNGMSIRFGLNAIKNVGEAAIKDILIKRKKGPFISFNDFCFRTDSQKINKKVLESLIKVGATDSFGPRNSILASLEEIKKNCDKIKKNHISGQFGLFDSVSTVPDIPLDNFSKQDTLDDKQKLSWEKELLGIYVSQNPLSKLLKKYQNGQTTTIDELETITEETNVDLTAVISLVKVIRTKKDNKQMAFLTISDQTGKIEAVVFPKTYELVKDLLVEDNVLYFKGKISFRDDQKSILIDQISDPSTIKTTETPTSDHPDFVINIPPKTNQSKLMKLSQLLKNNPNSQKGVIKMPDGKAIPISFGVNYTPKLAKQIDEIFAIDKNDQIN